ncbi:MAG: DNA-binding protein, partial [Deltaproteobacteria bacterium]|nr:DNA-binding protein [Deltaproteobacteria bacterium]
CPPEAVKIGMPVEVVYEDFEDYTLPKFRPAT